MELQLKGCTRCGEEKPLTLEFFPPHNKKRDGLDSWCRKCRSTYRSETRRGTYRHMMPDEELKALISSNPVCVICGQPGPRLCVDHDHQTNQVRGILCMNCNHGLGQFKDDPELLEFARIYLLSSRGDPEADQYIEEGLRG